MNTLENKTVFITGATGGIGKEMAKALSKEKCNLFLTSTDTNKLELLKKELGVYNNKVSYCSGDLTDIDDIATTIIYARQAFAEIDILVNCAGIFIEKPILKCNIEEYDNMMNICVKAPFIFSKEFSVDMKKKRWGRIVNLISTSAYHGHTNHSLYCTAKHALLGLSRSLFKEFKEDNIRVLAVCPASAKTHIGTQNTSDQDYNTFLEPSEIASYIINAMKLEGNMIEEEIRLNRYIQE